MHIFINFLLYPATYSAAYAAAIKEVEAITYDDHSGVLIHSPGV